MRKKWDGKWFNTTKGRRELLVQMFVLNEELDRLKTRTKFIQALVQKAVVELQKKQSPNTDGSPSRSRV